MTRSNLAMRWTGDFLWCWWRQTGLALLARRNVHDIHLLSVSRRVLTDYKLQAIGLVAGHHRKNDLSRLRRR
jgi:hypothetical protein